MRDEDMPESLSKELTALRFSFLELVIEDGSFELLKNLHFLEYQWSHNAIEKAACSENRDIVKWVWENTTLRADFSLSFVLNRTIDIEECINSAARRGDLVMMKWWCKEIPSKIPKNIITVAAHSGSLELLNWLINEGYELKGGEDLPAARKGHIEVLEAFRKYPKFVFYWSRYVVEYAALSGDINVVTWLLKHDAPLPRTCEAACISGKKEIVALFRARGVRFTTNSFSLAAKDGSIDFLEWLLDNGCSFDQSMVAAAVKANRLDILQWAHNRGYNVWKTGKDPEDTTLLMALEGSVEMLQWARSIGVEISPQGAIAAAQGGKLNILQWLHHTMNCGLHSELIEHAFPKHPNVVKWLRMQKVAWPGQS